MLSWWRGEVAGEGDRVTGGGGQGTGAPSREEAEHIRTLLWRGVVNFKGFLTLLLWKENK